MSGLQFSYTPPFAYSSNANILVGYGINLQYNIGATSITTATINAVNYTIYQYTTVGSFDFKMNNTINGVKILIVGGGGGGGGGSGIPLGTYLTGGNGYQGIVIIAYLKSS
jgi:hypothetical protein